MIVSLSHKVVVYLCLFNLQRSKKRKVKECCGVWCLCVLEAPCSCLFVYTLRCVFVESCVFILGFVIIGLKVP